MGTSVWPMEKSIRRGSICHLKTLGKWARRGPLRASPPLPGMVSATGGPRIDPAPVRGQVDERSDTPAKSTETGSSKGADAMQSRKEKKTGRKWGSFGVGPLQADGRRTSGIGELCADL